LSPAPYSPPQSFRLFRKYSTNEKFCGSSLELCSGEAHYNAKITAEQLKSGFDYAALRQTISVVITDHTLLPQEGPYLNYQDLRNRESGNLFTDLQQYVTLELSKLPEEDDGRPVWPFLKFFKCRTEEEFEMLKKRYPEVQPQVEEYQRLSWSKRRRLLADYWEKQRRDARAAMDYARDEGLEEGLEKGREEIARNALAKGIPLETVSEITGLDIETIKNFTQ
jgi:predicted transposase/invertase (TIGR01784 family)